MQPDFRRSGGHRCLSRISTISLRMNYFIPLASGILAILFNGQVLAVLQPEDQPVVESKPVTISQAKELLLTGSYREAIDAFEVLAGDSKTKTAATLGLAEARMRIGEYKEAAAALEALDAPKSARRTYLLAQVHLNAGRYDEALQQVRESIKLDDQHAGARLLEGRILELLGRRDEAIDAYRWFDQQIVQRPELPRDPAWVTDAGLGFLRYSVLTETSVTDRTEHVLNEMLQVAYTRLDRGYWPARIAAANLLREKYNNNEEDGSVSDYFAALKINPRLPEAHVGLGEVALAVWNFEEVEHRAELALEINPNYAPAHTLLAEKFILERRYDQAISAAEEALKLNPNDLAALSLIAAGQECKYARDAAAKTRERVFAINPRCALYHRIVGDALSGIRQYAASEEHYLKAIELDRTDANARTELGMMYMQWGDETKARDALDGAWKLDPFNERTKFTLELLDRLDKFARHETPHFIIKYDAEKDAGLGPYVADYLESTYSAVTGDFSAEPDEKTIIEFFPTHKAFAVRITGKPWIYTVGASTGRVIALTAPRDATHTMGQYNLARVLKHEFVHTVTLAATHNRIPHWFTEGLAVYQEDSPRSFEWAELLTDAMRRDRLFTLESIDWGFIRPKRSTDRQMAYAQSEWMVEFIIDRFGYDAIQKMLNRYQEGATQAQVLRELFELELAEFDKAFGQWSREGVARWACTFDLAPLEDVIELRSKAEESGVPDILGRLARAEYDASEYDRAEAAARRALELNPNERTALEIFVSLHSLLIAEAAGESRKKLEDDTLPYAERLLAIDANNRMALKLKALIALRRKENALARDAFERLQRICAMDPASFRGLAGIYLEEGDDDKALPQLLELARIDQTDSAIPKRVAEIIRRKGNLSEAAYWYRQAIFINPFAVDLHEALGSTYSQSNDYTSALREYDMLTKIEPTSAGHFESAAVAALKAGDRETAQRFAAQATKLNPASNINKMFESGAAP